MVVLRTLEFECLVSIPTQRYLGGGRVVFSNVLGTLKNETDSAVWAIGNRYSYYKAVKGNRKYHALKDQY